MSIRLSRWTVLLAIAASCGPSMDDQPSLEAYEEAMPPMPEGTVARAGGDPLPGEEASSLVNPFPDTAENRARGAALFAVHCSSCHGEGGRGDGRVAKLLGDEVEVRDLAGEHVAALTDGEIFRTITSGNGAMLGLRGLIAPEERWLIVLAVRELPRLERVYGPGRWRKRKGVARVRIEAGAIFLAELHWYEAPGIGRKEFKIKRVLSK